MAIFIGKIKSVMCRQDIGKQTYRECFESDASSDDETLVAMTDAASKMVVVSALLPALLDLT